MYISFTDNLDEDLPSQSTEEYRAFGFISAMDSSHEERVKKRLHSSTINNSIRSTAHNSPTSNIYERLFSRATLVMTAQRRPMDPITLENILVFRYNKDLWSVGTIELIRKEEEKERAAEKERKRLEDVAAKRARLALSADADRDDISSTDST